ncbi:hypothetical protein [Micromonospora sp. NPDC023956]|uniref:hypothetical protein n=1 Tax=Micromonospora sp. NPDC023956 TaxID=3155722 RepID=UPI003408CAFC
MSLMILSAVAPWAVVRFPALDNPEPDAPGELEDLVGTLLNLVAWAGTAAGVAGVLITGTMMAISVKRGESSEHLTRLGLVLCGCILVAAAGPLAGFIFDGGTGGEGGEGGQGE